MKMKLRRNYNIFFLVLFGILLLALQLKAQSTQNALIIHEIELRGNSKTKPSVIYNYLTFQPGDTLTVDRIEQSRLALQQSGFFHELDVFTRPGEVKGQIIAVVQVKERRWPYFQFAGGHSDLEGWYIVPASVRFDNMLGRGNILGLNFLMAYESSKIFINYKYPFLFDGAAWLSAELFAGGRNYVHYLNGDKAEQEVGVAGLKLSAGGNQGIFKYVEFGYSSEIYNPDKKLSFIDKDSTLVGNAIPDALLPYPDTSRVNTVSFAIRIDKRDDAYYPQNGHWGALILERATQQFKSDFTFNRVLFDTRWYHQLSDWHVLAFNFKAGFTSRETPFFKRFYLGGSYSLLGYDDRRLTPVGYGTSLVTSSLEYRFPIRGRHKLVPSLFGVLFCNAGGLWLPDDTFESRDIYEAFGFGVRFRVPIIGLTRFDIAFPTSQLDDKALTLHLSLGHTF